MSSCIFCSIVHYQMKALEKALECLFRQRRWPLFSVYIIDGIYAVSWKSFSVIVLSVKKWQSGFKGLCGRIVVDSDMNHHHLLCSKLELMAIGLSATPKILDKQPMFAVFDPVGGKTLMVLWVCVVFYRTLLRLWSWSVPWALKSLRLHGPRLALCAVDYYIGSLMLAYQNMWFHFCYSVITLWVV